MAYVLNSTTIRRPYSFNETNSSQMAQNRALDGSINRDYFGSNKRVWILDYQNTNKTDFDVINTIYTNYLASASAVTWSVTETNYPVSSTNVHVDLQERGFSVRGTDYLSDFTLILTEA